MKRSLGRAHRDASVPQLKAHTIGNALVVHPDAGMTRQAQALAFWLAPDHEYDLVVVDLPPDSPISLWDSVAKLLRRRRRGVRLVIGGRSRETAALAGQLLAERISRPVVAPDGAVIPSAGGALFVDSGRGSGWVRFEPGRAPTWEGKRFPRPAWDSALTAEVTSTSSRGVAEPLPGGMWVRPVGFDREQSRHRSSLINMMPAQFDTMTIVLGCPRCPALTLDDAARAWMRMPEDERHHVRFVQYGPVVVPPGTTTGQGLADLLGKEVAFYTVLPVRNPQSPEIRTVLFDGSPGWGAFACALAYRPRPAPDVDAPVPRLLSHRPPMSGLTEIEPAVYWYAPDAVLEVVQSGLLVRPPNGSRNASALRTLAIDNNIGNVTFDAPDAAGTARMRALACDVLARLDEHTRRVSRVLPAADLLAERSRLRMPAQAMAEIDEGDSGHASALDESRVTDVIRDVAPAPALEQAGVTEVVVPGVGADDREGTGYALAAIEQSRPTESIVSRAVTSGDQSVQGVETGAPAPDEAARQSRISEVLRPEPQTKPPALSTALSPVGASSLPPGLAEAMPSVASRVISTPADSPATPSAADSVVAPRGVAAASTHVAGQRAGRLQDTPSADVMAVVPGHHAGKEREWLRKSLGPEFGVRSNAAARILSEHPGFQGSVSTSATDVLTDAVAVQLYLSPKGAVIDSGLRAGTNGPHVPIARCVVAGLRRLPSHRGPSTFPASLTTAEWEVYQSQRIITEWSFLNALTEPSSTLPGDTDIVLWSITGRRTKLFEPQDGGVDNRVVFMPGTSFKVLELREPAGDQRGAVLLRELAAGEMGTQGKVTYDRTSLDDLALQSLRREIEVWAETGDRRPIDQRAVRRFAVPPALV